MEKMKTHKKGITMIKIIAYLIILSIVIITIIKIATSFSVKIKHIISFLH